jgi:hypothetical protein
VSSADSQEKVKVLHLQLYGSVLATCSTSELIFEIMKASTYTGKVKRPSRTRDSNHDIGDQVIKAYASDRSATGTG